MDGGKEGERLLVESLHFFRNSDVCFDGVGLYAILFRELPGKAERPFCIGTVGQRQMDAFGCKNPGDSCPDSPGAACNNRDFIGQL